MAVEIRIETPLQDDVRAMVAELNASMIPLTPREFQFQMTADEMASAGMTTFVARNEQGTAVGMSSLKVHDAGLGEVKRMFTRPDVRGRRIGSTLLVAVEALADEKSIDRLVLETGEAPGFEAAWRVYERGGFVTCGAVLDYPDSGYSRFYEKTLSR